MINFNLLMIFLLMNIHTKKQLHSLIFIIDITKIDYYLFINYIICKIF